jgi:hypothetical protein
VVQAKCLVLGFFLCLLVGTGPGLVEFATHAKYASGASSSTYVLDGFESLNTTDSSEIISLDEHNGNMAGCAEFSGSVQHPKLSNNSSISSVGGTDILIFGWTTSSGYWSTSMGGTGNEFCNGIRWIDDHSVAVVGAFQGQLSIAGTMFHAVGNEDGILAKYNVTNGTWVQGFAIGTLTTDALMALTPLSNGSLALVGTTQGNLSGALSLPNPPDCTPVPPATSTACTFVLTLSESFQPEAVAELKSTGNVIGRDIIEIGSSGKVLMIGYFQKLIMDTEHISNTPISSVQNSNDIFIARYSSNLAFENLATVGGNSTDMAFSIAPHASGFAVAGLSESTNESRVRVVHPSNGWIGPAGFGDWDGLLLQLSSTGAVVDGFLTGTAGNDWLYDADRDERGLLHVSGSIGSLYTSPTSTTMLGVNGAYSAFYGVVNFSGGSSSNVIDAYASTGSQNSDGRANAVAVANSGDVWLGGRLVPGAISNIFFGAHANSGGAEAGYFMRIGSDDDGDAHPKRTDNCEFVSNPDQANHDQDAYGNACDDDDDNDGLHDEQDSVCPLSVPLGFISTPLTDHDGDGCADESEDLDDDNDGFSDLLEAESGCEKGVTNWSAGDASFDRDADGCHDEFEDQDDDGDGYVDAEDDFCSGPASVVYQPSTWTDYDHDGCHDDEDLDIDNDGVPNDADTCGRSQFGWLSTASDDHDADGCRDLDEDNDDDNDGLIDEADQCTPPDMMSILGTASFPAWADHDQDGCHDEEDNDDDNDLLADELDACPMGERAWNRTAQTDHDQDGCRDDSEDTDDDQDGVNDAADDCDPDSGFRYSNFNWSSNYQTDLDGDGCQDNGPEHDGHGEDEDNDNDGLVDTVDQCPNSPMIRSNLDLDGDGCFDEEDQDVDGDGLTNVADACPSGTLFLQSDVDDDGCDDLSEDDDDDNDGVLDANDECDPNDPGPFMTEWLPSLLPNALFSPSEDIDGDGCADDSVEDKDDDNDGVLDDLDQCDPDSSDAPYVLGWSSIPSSDHDSDGCRDSDEDLDDDGDGVLDSLDACDPDSGDSDSKLGWTSTLNNDQNENGCHDIDEDKEMRAQLEEQERKTTMLVVGVGVGLVGIVIVAVIVAGRTKGQEINITGSSIEGPLKIVGGQANNLVDQSQQHLIPSQISEADDAE